MENKDKIILDLCGGTGAWSKPYKEAGYDVRIIDIKDGQYSDITLPSTQSLAVAIKPYGILAAPPCTMFSLARTRAKTERDFRKGMLIVKSCLEIIWGCRYEPKYTKDGCLKFWALENPVGFLRQFLGMPYFSFNPSDFGESYTKKTDLWGYFNSPKKNPVKLTRDEKYRCSQNSRKLPSISDITSSKQSIRRAITPAGFAKAFFEANQ